MRVENIPIKSLVLSDLNPRSITKEALNQLCKNIENDPAFLWQRPVLVNHKDGVYHVYAGTQRINAAKKLGWKEIPCSVEEDLSDEVMRSRTLLDNKHGGDWDWDILANNWEIDDLLSVGFTHEEMELDVKTIENEEENEILEPPKDPITKLGDLYELGNHRLLCGDSTLPDDVQKLLNGAEPILMVTDPPYGVNYDAAWRYNAGIGTGKQAVGKVQNDDKANWALAWYQFPGSIAYIWHAGKHCSEVRKSLEDCDYAIINQIVWAKQHFALSRGDYHWQHECCWYGVRKGHKHNWQGSRKEATLWQISNQNAFGNSKDEDERTAHSTQKPLECMARPIRNNTAEGEGVYDPFLGSGTTLIAAEKLNRICYGMEIDPAYCDIIVKRWMKLMGNKFKKNGEWIDKLEKDRG